MGFEVRTTGQQEGEELTIGPFPDGEWINLLALARECGFGPGEEYGRLADLKEGAPVDLDTGTVQRLHVGVSAVLNQDTLPFAATWEADDARLHFRWVAGPRAGSTFSLDAARLRRLADRLYSGPVLVSRVQDPAG